MVTASHNPPKYNGYKVFWSDGAQVTPPNDKMIINHYNKIQRFEDIPTKDFDSSLEKGLITILGENMESKYQQSIKSKMISHLKHKQMEMTLVLCLHRFTVRD